MKQPTIEDVYDMLKLVLKRQVALEEKLTKKEKKPVQLNEALIEKSKIRAHS